MRLALLMLALVGACSTATLNRCDPPVQYAPDPKCDQLDDVPCGKDCCNSSRGSACNPVSGRCESSGPLPDWYSPVPVGHSRDGGARDACGIASELSIALTSCEWVWDDAGVRWCHADHPPLHRLDSGRD